MEVSWVKKPPWGPGCIPGIGDMSQILWTWDICTVHDGVFEERGCGQRLHAHKCYWICWWEGGAWHSGMKWGCGLDGVSHST